MGSAREERFCNAALVAAVEQRGVSAKAIAPCMHCKLAVGLCLAARCIQCTIKRGMLWGVWGSWSKSFYAWHVRRPGLWLVGLCSSWLGACNAAGDDGHGRSVTRNLQCSLFESGAITSHRSAAELQWRASSASNPATQQPNMFRNASPAPSAVRARNSMRLTSNRQLLGNNIICVGSAWRTNRSMIDRCSGGPVPYPRAATIAVAP